jgi:hypothetical protein
VGVEAARHEFGDVMAVVSEHVWELAVGVADVGGVLSGVRGSVAIEEPVFIGDSVRSDEVGDVDRSFPIVRR